MGLRDVPAVVSEDEMVLNPSLLDLRQGTEICPHNCLAGHKKDLLCNILDQTEWRNSVTTSKPPGKQIKFPTGKFPFGAT